MSPTLPECCFDCQIPIARSQGAYGAAWPEGAMALPLTVSMPRTVSSACLAQSACLTQSAYLLAQSASLPAGPRLKSPALRALL